MAATLGQTPGQHVRGIAGLADDLLDACEGLRGDVGPIIQDARNRLRGHAGRRGDFPDRQALLLGHETSPPRRELPLQYLRPAVFAPPSRPMTSAIDSRSTAVLDCYRSRYRYRER